MGRVLLEDAPPPGTHSGPFTSSILLLTSSGRTRQLTCEDLPPDTAGWAVIELARNGSHLPNPGLRTPAISRPRELFPVQTDEDGTTATSIPLPAALAGEDLLCRFLFPGIDTPWIECDPAIVRVR